jgi:hypothetical protein
MAKRRSGVGVSFEFETDKADGTNSFSLLYETPELISVFHIVEESLYG